MDGSTHWRTSLRTRAAIVAVTAVGLVLWGLLGVGAKAPLPFQARPVSTPAADKFAVAESLDPSGGASSFNDDAVALGPNHSLYFYWLVRTTGTWYGPLQIAGAGTAYSGPSISVDVSANINVAVEGPNHSLLFFWQIGSTWYGPLQIGGAGSTYSAPSAQIDTSTGNVNVSAQGPNGSLYFWWAIGGAWSGPLQIAGPGRAFSAPSVGDTTATGSGCSGGGGPTHSCVSVAVEGPASQSVVYFAQDGTWLAPSTSGTNQEYSAASGFNNPGNAATPWSSFYQGPGSSLIGQQSSAQGGSNTYCVIAGSGTTFAAPGAFVFSSHGGVAYLNIAANGPSGALYAYWSNVSSPGPSTCPAFYGPLQLNGAGTTFSVPAINVSVDNPPTNQVANILVEGPSHSLWAYWSTNGSWYGPIQLGGAGTTFDSAT